MNIQSMAKQMNDVHYLMDSALIDRIELSLKYNEPVTEVEFALARLLRQALAHMVIAAPQQELPEPAIPADCDGECVHGPYYTSGQLYAYAKAYAAALQSELAAAREALQAVQADADAETVRLDYVIGTAAHIECDEFGLCHLAYLTTDRLGPLSETSRGAIDAAMEADAAIDATLQRDRQP